MNSEHYENRGFHIITNLGKQIEACAQFDYRGYKISFSTVGVLTGGCSNHVIIMHGKEEVDIKSDLTTVQEAIDYINFHLGPAPSEEV